MNHYDWLNENFEPFCKSLGIPCYPGTIVAHGDKCYSYSNEWEERGIPFAHGVAIYLITYQKPYSEMVRQTENGWVPVDEWIVNNYHKFISLLPIAPNP